VELRECGVEDLDQGRRGGEVPADDKTRLIPADGSEVAGQLLLRDALHGAHANRDPNLARKGTRSRAPGDEAAHRRGPAGVASTEPPKRWGSVAGSTQPVMRHPAGREVVRRRGSTTWRNER